MWYSSLSTGIINIDLEHSNIDSLIKIVINQNFPLDMTVKLIDAALAHFNNEEDEAALAGYEFTEDHKEEHLSIVKKLKSLKNEVVEGVVPTEDAVLILKATLIDHVQHFDLYITETPMAEKVQPDSLENNSLPVS